MDDLENPLHRVVGTRDPHRSALISHFARAKHEHTDARAVDARESGEIDHQLASAVGNQLLEGVLDGDERIPQIQAACNGEDGDIPVHRKRAALGNHLRNRTTFSGNLVGSVNKLLCAAGVLGAGLLQSADIDLEEARQRMEPVDAPGAARMLANLKKQIDHTRKELEKASEVKKTVANRAAANVDSLRGALKTWFSFYDGYDPVFTWWDAQPY